MATGLEKQGCKRASSTLILKEGFLYKKGHIIKIWSRKYFVLTRESLNYFKRESEMREPMGRVFLSDVTDITTEGLDTKRSFVFAVHTKRRCTLLQGSNVEDMENWVRAIREALETDKELERKDPFRKTLRRLEPGLKRVTLVKDPQKGIGCTIKNAAGHILVNRIIEDGPIAMSGVLRPGDEILDIQGTTVTGLQIQEIGEIIKSAPDEFLATVRPITVLKKNMAPPDNTEIIYSTIAPAQASEVTSHNVPAPKFLIEEHIPDLRCGSLDDVGTYDDDEEDSIPPPIPTRTEDAFILLDPATSSSRAKHLKASSEVNLISRAHEIKDGCPPPIPLRTDESRMINGAKDTCQLPPLRLPLKPGGASSSGQDGKGILRSLSEDNVLCEPGSGCVGGANQAGSRPKDSRSLQRGQRQHDYDEITFYAELAPLKCASKR
eukprot:Em0005g1594a